MKRLTKKEKAAIEKRCYLILDAARELRENYPTCKYIVGAIKDTMDIKRASTSLLSKLQMAETIPQKESK